MRVGDFLEWVAGGLAVAATLLATHQIWTALLAAAGFLAYQAQCYSTDTLPRPSLVKLRRPRRRLRAVTDGHPVKAGRARR